MRGGEVDISTHKRHSFRSAILSACWISLPCHKMWWQVVGASHYHQWLWPILKRTLRTDRYGNCHCKPRRDTLKNITSRVTEVGEYRQAGAKAARRGGTGPRRAAGNLGWLSAGIRPRHGRKVRACQPLLGRLCQTVTLMLLPIQFHSDCGPFLLARSRAASDEGAVQHSLFISARRVPNLLHARRQTSAIGSILQAHNDSLQYMARKNDL